MQTVIHVSGNRYTFWHAIVEDIVFSQILEEVSSLTSSKWLIKRSTKANTLEVNESQFK